MSKSAHIITLVLFVFYSFGSFAQSKQSKGKKAPAAEKALDNTILLPAFTHKGETLPLVTLAKFDVVAERTFKTEKDRQAYLKLKRDVKKAYPYAVLASVKMREYDALIASMPEKKQSGYLKKAEKELREQFEKDLKNLTMSQGRILIRLIDRETGMSTYKVIKDYRGSLTAFM